MSEYRGFFINLLKNERRRRRLLEHLGSVSRDHLYERFEGVDGSLVSDSYQTSLGVGQLGCWLSHEKLLDSQRNSIQHLHVIEADCVLLREGGELYNQVLFAADGSIKDWDIIFTDILPPLNFNFIEDYVLKIENFFTRRDELTVVDLEDVEFACTSSYFVNRRSIGKLADLLTRGIGGKECISISIRGNWYGRGN